MRCLTNFVIIHKKDFYQIIIQGTNKNNIEEILEKIQNVSSLSLKTHGYLNLQNVSISQRLSRSFQKYCIQLTSTAYRIYRLRKLYVWSLLNSCNNQFARSKVKIEGTLSPQICRENTRARKQLYQHYKTWSKISTVLTFQTSPQLLLYNQHYSVSFKNVTFIE